MPTAYLWFVVLSSISLDESRVLTIKSDEVVQDINANVSTWTGSVLANQGPYELAADVIRLEYNELNQPCILRAVGNPVHATGPVKAEFASVQGEVLLYDCNQQKARLARSASIQGAGHNLRAENIIYDFIQRELSASGSGQSKVQVELDLPHD